MAAMAGDGIKKDAREEYKAVTKQMLNDMMTAICQRKKSNQVRYPEKISQMRKKIIYELALDGLFSGKVDYHERQFIYIAKNVDALAGCYDDNIQWLFTIDALPKGTCNSLLVIHNRIIFTTHIRQKEVYICLSRMLMKNSSMIRCATSNDLPSV